MNQESTAVVSIEEQVKQQLALQQSKAAQMMGKVNLISFKGGQLLISGTPVPNSEAEVVILAQQSERAYYPGVFDASKAQVPVCYSFDLITPHPAATVPQHATCEDCPQNEWGSNSRGKGKACREGARVALVPASVALATAPLYQASFPITSMGSVKEFFTRCENAGKLSGQYLTRLKVVPDAKSFFKASLTPLSMIEGQDLAALIERMTQARNTLIEPYPVFDKPEEEDEDEDEAPVAKGKKKKY